MCQNVSKCAKMCQNVTIYVKICQNVPWRLWPQYVVCQSVWLSVHLSKYVHKMCQNISKCVKMYPGGGGLNTWYVCPSVHLTVWNVLKMCQNVSNICQNISKYVKMCQNMHIMCQNVAKCPNVPKCVNMFQNYIIAWPSDPVGSIFTHGPRRWNHGSTDGFFILLLLLLLHTTKFVFFLGTENADFQTGLTF